MGDALRRRCLHLYIPFPDAERERRIVQIKVPNIPETLRNQLVDFIHQLRDLDLKKLPAVSETIDWARTLLLMHADKLDPDMVRDTLNVILKFQDDAERVDTELRAMVRRAQEGR
jgi:MoxR-like ATPase